MKTGKCTAGREGEMRSRANEQEQQYLLNRVCSPREAVLALYSKKQCAEDKHQQNGWVQSIRAHKSTLAARLSCCYHYPCFVPSLLKSISDAAAWWEEAGELSRSLQWVRCFVCYLLQNCKRGHPLRSQPSCNKHSSLIPYLEKAGKSN